MIQAWYSGFLTFSLVTVVQARIVEVREEIERVLSESSDGTHKADSIIRLLQDKKLGFKSG